MSIEVDQVIMDIGRPADLSFVGVGRRLPVDRGVIYVDRDTLDTGMEGVYTGGDVVAMPGAIIRAIATPRYRF
ncbi:MAG: hypothetical protein R6X27_08695 [Candidatus Desulfacyla sp.]